MTLLPQHPKGWLSGPRGTQDKWLSAVSISILKPALAKVTGCMALSSSDPAPQATPLQTRGFASTASLSCITFPFQLCILLAPFSLGPLSQSPLPSSLLLSLSHLPLLVSPFTASSVYMFSPCSGLFQTALPVLSLISIIKTLSSARSW